MSAEFPSFDQFFAATHRGRAPYDWQVRLANRVERLGWPAQVAIPTGLGKTATISITIYELARQLHFDGPRSAPQRIFHVVERRTIIDTAAGYARDIAEQVNTANADDTVLHPVREALRKLLGEGDDRPILVASVHGESADPRETWRATGCTIVSLSAHQFVSRLLFRGFGMGAGSRPIAAALCGVDRIVLFDEPHLAEQAVHTILGAERLQMRSESPLALPAVTVLLGATVSEALRAVLGDAPSREEAGAPFEIDAAAEMHHPESARRLRASRKARIRWSSGSDVDTVKHLVAAAGEARASGAERVVVFANTVTVAQAAYRKLRDATSSASAAKDRLRLVTSRFRPADRGAVLDEALASGPCTIVATQTLEVGVDISFDALVTESCSWSALVQRLGRLNRDGRSTGSTAEIVCGWDERAGAVVRRGTRAVYGQGVVERVTELLRALEEEQGESIDLGFAGLESIAHRQRLDLSILDPAPARLGTLHSAMVPLMVQTRPTPVPDFPLHALIAGPDARAIPEVEVAWRTDLSVFDAVDDARVDPAEFVTIPRSALAAFLKGDHRSATAFGDTGSTASETTARRWDGGVSLSDFRVWDRDTDRWRRPEDAYDVERASRVIMLPTLRGYDGELGWTGLRGEHRPTPQDLSLRLSLAEFVNAPDRPGSLPDLVLSVASLAACRTTTDEGHEDPDLSGLFSSELVEELTVELRRIEDLHRQGVPGNDIVTDVEDTGERVVRRLLEPIGRTRFPATVTAAVGDTAAVHVRFGLVPRSHREDTVLLDDHQRQVARWAHGDALRAGLPSELSSTLAVAGRLHDEGKRDIKVQQFFYDAAEPLEEVLAKSRPGLYSGAGGLRRERNARKHWGIDGGWRHEGSSLARVGIWLDPLARHCIGSHHGWGRPILPPAHPLPEAGYPAPLGRADELAALNDRYGPWGLAFLEAVLRLADWRASGDPRPGLDPSDPHLPAAIADPESNQQPTNQQPTEQQHAEPHPVDPRPSDHRSAAPAPHIGERLLGLHTHPLTAWFASAGLLASAREAGDDTARLHWEPLTNGAETPIVPVLTSSIPAADLAERIVRSEEWGRAERLARAAGFARGLGVKNQRLQPAGALGRLLRQAEDQEIALLIGIVGDLTAINASGTVDLPITALANNSSYVSVALRATTGAERNVRGSAREAAAALGSFDAGYASEKCDGGMDRSEAVQPGVNGLGDAKHRQSRVALAPLAVFGMSRIGAGTPSGAGVERRNLVLPLPTMPMSFAELRALTLMGRGDSAPGRWERYGLGWVYAAEKDSPSTYEVIWKGRIEPRRRQTLPVPGAGS